jgi:uncharacterized membrane protein YfcA
VTLALLAFVAFLGFTVEATAGFGSMVVALTLAAWFLPIDRVLVSLLPVNVLLSGYLTWRYRREVDGRVLTRRVLLWMVPGMLLGMAPAALVSVWPGLAGGARAGDVIRGVFAAFVVALAAAELWRARQGTAADTRALPAPVAASALVGAGVIHGLFACGGPLLVYVVGRELTDKARFRATLSAVWLLLNGALLVPRVVVGDLDREALTGSGVMVASLVGGLALGEWLHHRLPVARFRIAVFALLLVAGLALLVRSLRGT